MRFNDCFLGKTSQAKNLQIVFKGGTGWVGGGPKRCYMTCVPQVKTGREREKELCQNTVQEPNEKQKN